MIFIVRIASALVFTFVLRYGSASAQYDPFEKECALGCSQDMQVIGWSQDEEYYAVRLYCLYTDSNPMVGGYPLPVDCEGYVSHVGKAYNGGLSIHIFHGGQVVENHPIQDADTCTPLPVARERLKKARAALKSYGICLTNPGRILYPEDNRVVVDDSTQGSYTLVHTLDVQYLPDSGYVDGEIHRGSQSLSLLTGGDTVEVLHREINEEVPVTSGYTKSRGCEVFCVSPSGDRILVLGYTKTFSYAGQSRCLWLWGELCWVESELRACRE
ncbi:MAG TPA: hypothetical protein VMY05_10095 [Acidobacteriota bacterium]|nr:hypothetical protein [Acidobacteriota bacterium]